MVFRTSLKLFFNALTENWCSNNIQKYHERNYCQCNQAEQLIVPKHGDNEDKAKNGEITGFVFKPLNQLASSDSDEEDEEENNSSFELKYKQKYNNKEVNQDKDLNNEKGESNNNQLLENIDNKLSKKKRKDENSPLKNVDKEDKIKMLKAIQRKATAYVLPNAFNSVLNEQTKSDSQKKLEDKVPIGKNDSGSMKYFSTFWR